MQAHGSADPFSSGKQRRVRKRRPWRLAFGWLALGLIVCVVGLVFLLDVTGVLPSARAVDRLWPLAIVAVAIGALALAEIRASIALAALLIATGVLLLLVTTHVLEHDRWDYLWPVAVMLSGLVLIARAFKRPKLRSRAELNAIWPSRFHIHARMFVVRGTDKIGSVIAWLCTGGRPALLMLAGGGMALIWLPWWGVLALYAGLLLAWSAAKAKTRVVIETFEDHTIPAVRPAGHDSNAQKSGSEGGATAADQPDPHRLDASGLAGLLATRLAEMRNVYHLLEEPLGRPRPGPVEGAVQLEDIGDVLRSAFTTQSNLSIGPITLPFGGMMALLGRLMQAPHLRGALYGSDADLTLTARLTMHGRDYVWTVSRPEAAGGALFDGRTHIGSGRVQSDTRSLGNTAVPTVPPQREGDAYASSASRRVPETGMPMDARAQMVGELAYRVFTDLSLRNQAEWPATKYWLDALRERQACQRTPRDRRYHLTTAESHLCQALAEDERFYLAAYNLGIVYRQLGEEDAKRQEVANDDPRHVPDDDLRGVRDEPYTRSALRVFKYAIEKLDRGRWEAYYGLALADWKLAERDLGDVERRLNRVVDDCDRALDLASGRAARAQILDLKAMAQNKLGRTIVERELGYTQSPHTEAQQREIALAMARNEACQAALQTWNRACRAILRELTLTQLWRVPGDGQHILRLRKQAARCLLNLGIAYDAVKPVDEPDRSSGALEWARRWRRREQFARTRALTNAAVRLADVDAEAHQKFAEIACKHREYAVARDELQHAIRIDQDNAAYWAMLALASARNATAAKPGRRAQEARDAALIACRGAEAAIDFGLLGAHTDTTAQTATAATASDDSFDALETPCRRLTAAYAELAMREDGEALASRLKLGRKIADALPRDSFSARRDRGERTDLERKIDQGKAALSGCLQLAALLGQYSHNDWEAAIIERHLGHQLLVSSAAITQTLISTPENAATRLDELLTACRIGIRAHESDLIDWHGGPAIITGHGARVPRPLLDHGAALLDSRGPASAVAEYSHGREPGNGRQLSEAPPSAKDIAAELAHAAEDVIADAIERLSAKHATPDTSWRAQPEHAVDIRRWGLLGEQARAIVRQPDRTGVALPLAEDAVAIDPLCADAWRALALVREHGGDYMGACTAWMRVQWIEPEDPECRVALALSQWRYSAWTVDATERRDLLREALENLHRAREHYDIAQMEERRRVEWWAAKCHWTLGQFEEMPSHLRFILATLEKLHPPPEERALRAVVELALAQSYRQTRHFAEAEDYAQRATEDADRAVDGNGSGCAGFPPDACPAAPLEDDQWTLLAVQTLARSELAGCHADRDCALSEDIALCDAADELLDRFHAVDDEAQRRCTPLRSDVLAERGRIQLARGHATEAVSLLRRATREGPASAGSYIALARAYELLASEQDGPEAMSTLQKARASCERAKGIVGEHHPQFAEAQKLERRLDEPRLMPAVY